MNLYICEKPSLAKALFNGLGGNDNLAKSQQKNGYFEINNHFVTFCFGHMLELLDPEDFDERYKQWSFDLLPFKFPIKHKVKKEAKKQYSIISKLIKKATTIYNVGDPDEEGQLLIDEIIEFEKAKQPVKRLFIADYNISAVKKSIANVEDNNKHIRNGHYALARSVSDQLFGYNLTRAYTLAARLKGYDGLFNIGRVQTGIVNLIDERCHAVENHKDSYYFNVIVNFNINKTLFPAKYITTENDTINDKGQLIDQNNAQKILDQCNSQTAKVISAQHKQVEKVSPMPYTMATLQSDCARKFGITAQTVLDTVQALYETHKVLTYPRTNCQYLGTEHFNDRREVLNAIAKTNPVFGNFVKGATASKPHRCFNSDKVEAHHGIIPTVKSVEWDKLNELEQKIYNLVARSYIALLYPPSTFDVSELVIDVNGANFGVKAEVRTTLGWWQLYKNDTDNPDLETEENLEQPLSRISTGDQGFVESGSLDKRKAAAPKYFVESTLLRELTHIAKYITDPELKKAMEQFFKEKNIAAELGTEATRASIIDKVFESGFCEKVKEKGYKELAMKTTTIGKQFCSLLPDGCKKVDVTAEWVKMGIDVKSGKLTVDDYINKVFQYISKQVEHVKQNGINLKLDLESCPECFDGYLSLKKGQKSPFFACTNYPTCKVTFPEYKGKPYTQTHKCPECNKPLVLRNSGNEYFFGCTGWQEGCKNTMACVGGKPAKKVHGKRSARKPVKRKARG